MIPLLRKLSKILKKIRGPDCFMVIVTITIIPAFYLGEILFVLPVLYERWSFWYNVHFFMSLFLVHNIVANLAQGLQGPGNVRDDLMPPPTVDWRHCSSCECMVPPRSWHCSVCEVCVFKRDHHCNFFGCCVGYFNYRYFYMFVVHVFVATVYAMIVNCVFFTRYFSSNEFSWMSAFAFLFPLASLVVDWSSQNGYILLFVMNILFTVFTGYLFFYHTAMVIKGVTVGEAKKIREAHYNRGLKNNIIDCFGVRWYLVWISGLVHSPLPGDGTHWKKATD